MFPKFELICGEDIWQHVIIVVSNTGFYHNPCEEINFESWRRRIKGTLPKICQRSTLVFDGKKTDRPKERSPEKKCILSAE